MTGYEKLKNTAEKLKKESENLVKTEEKSMSIVKSQLEKIDSDHDLAKMYNDNALVGAENLSGNSPTLSIFTAGKSQTRLANGKKPTDGFFYYKPTQEEFAELNVHIFSISHGFQAKGMKRSDGTIPMVFNQLMTGVFITAEKEMKPFVMYLTGKKLNPMWEFGKEASLYTKRKPVAIPMFALTVKLTTKEETNEYGMSWVPVFEILKENGEPIVPTDLGEFVYLRDLVDGGKQMIDAIIKAKSSEDSDSVQDTKRLEEVDETNF